VKLALVVAMVAGMVGLLRRDAANYRKPRTYPMIGCEGCYFEYFRRDGGLPIPKELQ
jgi:hypothetical protein